MSVDTSELDALHADLLTVEARLVPKIKPIVSKAAVNVKNAMKKDARGHLILPAKGGRRVDPHLEQVINYDLNVFQFAGDASIEAEIGYDKHAGPQAALAGIAIFGTSKPGGGTVRDPVEALLDEAPNFLEYIGQACDGLL
jgi:hypothetical protein